MTVRELWLSTSLGPRLSLVCAAFAGALNAGTWIVSTEYVALTIAAGTVLLHLATGALFLTLHDRVKRHHQLGFRYLSRMGPWEREATRMREVRTPLPALLVWGGVAALTYLVVLFAWFW